MSRPVGSKNKAGALAKDNVQAVFTRLGGTAAMARWAKRNQTEFYRLYARLIPAEMVGPGGAPLQFTVVPVINLHVKEPGRIVGSDARSIPVAPPEPGV